MDIIDILGISQILEWGKEKLGIKREYHPNQINPVRFKFTPTSLLEYIGQENAKCRINTYIKKIQTIKAIHLIISGTRGHGKSTLAYIISRLLGLPMDTYVGGSFTMDNLRDFLAKHSDDKLPHILFLDEIHGLNKEISEFMLPLLQDFILPIGNLKVKPFLMIGCTTNLELLQKKSSPFVDRCDLIELERYNFEDIKKILMQYNDKVFQLNIDEVIYDKISYNCRFNPRTCLSIFDDYVVEQSLEKVLKGRQIVRNSLTVKDIELLKYMRDIGKPIGIKNLAIITQQTEQSYRELQEPFLLQQKYLSASSRGRIILDRGIKILQEIKHE